MLEGDIAKKQIELNHHQDYASVLGGSSLLHIGNLAGLSRDLLPRATMFAQYSDQASSMSAMQNLQAMKMMGRVPYTGNQLADYQIQMSAYNQFKEQALKNLKQQEIEVMNKKEREVQLELNDMNLQLQRKNKELETYKDLARNEVENSVPKFGM